MQSVSSRIWTRIVASNSCDDNHYTTLAILRTIIWRVVPNTFVVDALVLALGEEMSTHFLILLPSPLLFWVGVPVRDLSKSQIDVFEN